MYILALYVLLHNLLWNIEIGGMSYTTWKHLSECTEPDSLKFVIGNGTELLFTLDYVIYVIMVHTHIHAHARSLYMHVLKRFKCTLIL